MKVLLICPNKLGQGGVQNVFLQLSRNISVLNTQIDILVYTDETGCFEEELKTYGKIFHYPVHRSKNKLLRYLGYITNAFRIYRIADKVIKENGPYDAIHDTDLFMGAASLLAARRNGVPVRVAHSHVGIPEKSKFLEKMRNCVYRVIINRCATVRLGVTKGACTYLFGDKAESYVIKNPVVDLEKFNPSKYPETNDTSLNLLQVGSLCERKNAYFSIELLHSLRTEYNRNDARLTLIGEDNSETKDYGKSLKVLAERLGEKENVVFLPANSDVPMEMAKSTALLIPSFLEGLPCVSLEAQTMGLKCFVSDKVSTECDMGLCDFLPIDCGTEQWVEALLEFASIYENRKLPVNMAAYDKKKICGQYYSIWRGADVCKILC